MDNFKPLAPFGDKESLKICTEEYIPPSLDETPSEKENDKGIDSQTVYGSVNSEAEMETGDSREERSEEMVAENKQETVTDTYNTGFGESMDRDENPLAKIESLYVRLSEQISAMETLFTKRIMHTDYEDKIIDQLHGELQKYKEDLYSQLVRPILLDVIEVRDSILRIAATYLKKPEGEQSVPNKIFADYAYDLQDILEKNNVEIYRSESGAPFVPVRQRVIKKEVTNDESLHGKIAESLSSGYSYAGRVISAEKVSVYFYQKAVENKEESEDN